jgi:hypothetical protein
MGYPAELTMLRTGFKHPIPVKKEEKKMKDMKE